MSVEADIAQEQPVSASNTRGRFHLRLTRRWIVLIAALVAIPWMWIFASGAKVFSGHKNTPSSAITARTRSVGPWGELVIVPITLEPPVDFAARFLIYDSSTWYFRNCTRETLPDVLRSVGFPENLIGKLVTSANDHPAINGLKVAPDKEILFALTDEQRDRLYQLLANEPANYSKTDPFRFQKDAFDHWFDGSGLSDETLRLVRRMTYHHGDIAIFSDVSAVTASIASESEKVKLFRSLAQQSAIYAKLYVGPASDIDALARYWGRGSRFHEIRPLIKSISKVPGGGEINIALLLPAFARRRVHEYPQAQGSNPNTAQDCHWASMNFWNETPDDRFSDPAYVAQTIATDYTPVSPGEPYQFGDVLFLTRNGDQAIHSAVYIAADILFTKNGGTITSPWMLMKKDNLLAYYSMHGQVEVRAFRKK